MTTLGLIGSGNIGSTLARLALAASYDVVLSNSRGPDTLKELVHELGEHATAGTSAVAAAAGDLVVVTISTGRYKSVPVEPLSGKVVIDTMNYYPQRDGHIAALDDRSATSSALLQEHLPTSKVVKIFNNIFFKHLLSLARPAGARDRSALAIASDDAVAKATVTEFLDAIGYDAVDAGTLAESWRYEPDHPAYGAPYYGPGGTAGDAGTPVDAAALRAALDAARR